MCDTGRILIFLVWLLPSLCSGNKFHTRKINVFLPSSIIYYFLLSGHKIYFIAPCGEIFPKCLLKIVLSLSVLRRENGLFHNCCYFSVSKQMVKVLMGKITSFFRGEQAIFNSCDCNMSRRLIVIVTLIGNCSFSPLVKKIAIF